VGLHNGNSDLWYFTLKLQKIFNSLQENFEKNSICASFPLYFLCVFLISEKLVSKYEHLLILTDIAVSTLHERACWFLEVLRFTTGLLESVILGRCQC
jgi:hypothetical protein